MEFNFVEVYDSVDIEGYENDRDFHNKITFFNESSFKFSPIRLMVQEKRCYSIKYYENVNIKFIKKQLSKLFGDYVINEDFQDFKSYIISNHKIKDVFLFQKDLRYYIPHKSNIDYKLLINCSFTYDEYYFRNTWDFLQEIFNVFKK